MRAAVAFLFPSAAAHAGSSREVAITIDDLPRAGDTVDQVSRAGSAPQSWICGGMAAPIWEIIPGRTPT